MNVTIPLVILAIAAALYWLQERSFRRAIAAHERLLTKRDEEYKDLLDRFFQSRNLAPSGVDLAVEHEERRAQRETQNRTRVPKAIGSVDRVRNSLATAERSQPKDAS